MKKLILFDLATILKRKINLIIIILLFAFGIWAGGEAGFTLGDKLAYDSPYQISFIMAFLSLASIFFSTLFTGQLALKEMDSNFNLIFFSLPVTTKSFLWSRIISIFILSSSLLTFYLFFFDKYPICFERNNIRGMGFQK